MSDLTFSFAPLLPWPALIALGLLGVVALIAGAVAGQREGTIELVDGRERERVLGSGAHEPDQAHGAVILHLQIGGGRFRHSLSMPDPSRAC